MTSNRIPLILITALFLAGCGNMTSVRENTLHAGWEFREAGMGPWRVADVPGCIHDDLLRHGLIPDPFLIDNERKIQWVEDKRWEYRLEFSIPSEFGRAEHLTLRFEGLDTHADVYLDDSLHLTANNMFRAWEINLDAIAGKGTHTLHVIFHPAAMMDSIAASLLPYRLPDRRAFSRKAPYQYGWDWGPRLITCGIWKPVRLIGWNSVRLTSAGIHADSIKGDTAYMSAEAEVFSDRTRQAIFRLTDSQTGTLISNTSAELIPGQNRMTTAFLIDEPHLWWTNGLGESPLYHFRIEVISGKDRAILEKAAGCRTIKLMTPTDTIGRAFYFRLNGVPVFMKGANYIPMHSFPGRVDSSGMRQLITGAAAAGMNMLRVWGGGIYEDDLFYDLCDRHGILVWQDFMFACNMVPGDSAFVENVRQEAIGQVKRLKGHPCLALWCGNNESEEGWFNWGWQKTLGYTPEDSLRIWEDYRNIFHRILPGVVAGYDGRRSYWPSSPSTGWGHPEALNSGDMHYWGVWWGKEPFEVYGEKVGRFMSEYGFQGFPDMQTIREFMDGGPFDLLSPKLLNHQKHPTGMELIRTYMERDFVVPVNFEDYAYISQIVQAEGIRKAIEAHRRAMPWCMGTLYWQLNDCWPAISWSSIDHQGRWKALHYTAQDAYHNIALSCRQNDRITSVFIVSDSLKPFTARLTTRVTGFDGQKLWKKVSDITVPPQSAVKAMSLSAGELPSAWDPECSFLHAELETTMGIMAETVYYFVKPVHQKLPDARIGYEIRSIASGYQIRLWSDRLARFVRLDASPLQGTFSDNFFDLLPGDTVTARYTTDAAPDEMTKHFQLLHLAETIPDRPQ
ncbi:MAG: glycoside hydrolase family 2 protein [Bacteroidales bacterium]|nr:glycoside hydrolase family 2 protein [Bacteroidales bacterium]